MTVADANNRRSPLFWLVGLMAIGAIGALLMIYVDASLALRLRALDPRVIKFFEIVTHFGDSLLYLIPSALGVVGFRWAAARTAIAARRLQYRALARKALFLLVGVAGSGAVVQVLKFAIGRPRPRLLADDGTVPALHFGASAAVEHSFPSGHTNTVTVVMLAIWFLEPRFRALGVLLAVLVGSSRVIIGAHYLSDVMAGAIIAALTTTLLANWFRKYELI